MLLGFHWKRLLPALGLLCSACFVWLVLAVTAGSPVANANADTDFTYHPVADGIEITDYVGIDPEVVIPDTIDGLPVTSIGYGAFENKGLTKVTLNAGLLRIDSFAFSSNHLTEIKIPVGVVTLGNSSFLDNALTEIDIPATVKTIGPYAFYVNSIHTVMLNEGLETIQEGAFIDNPITKIIIPSTVSTIEGGAFQNNDLAYAVIPPSVTSMSLSIFDFNRPDFTIIGWPGSAAHNHATNRGISFADIATLPVPDVQFTPDRQDWAQTPAKTTVTGATYEYYNLRYAWSNTVTPPAPEAAWSSLTIGDEIEQSAEGEWYLHVNASPLGPAGSWHSERFRVDRTPPTLGVTMTAGPSATPYTDDTWSEWPVTIDATATDLYGDIREIVVETESGGLSSLAAYPGDTYSVTFAANGTYRLKITAFDQAGNVSAEEQRIVKIGNSPSPGSTTDGESGNARLKELILSDGVLTPAFSGDVTEYTLRIDPAASSVNVALLPEHALAKTSLNGQSLGSGSVKADVSLEPDVRQFKIVVTAEDGTKRTYQIALERDEADPAEAPPTGEACKARSTFNDIAGHWGEPFIIEAGCQGIVQGYPDGSFKPDRLVTRAEFTVMLAGVFQWEDTETAISFSDLAGKDHWAKQAIAHAAAAGIVSGYPDGRFRPDATITRAEMAVMIARALGLPTDAGLHAAFADDADVPAWAKSAVASVHRQGIVVGRGGNRFVPVGAATRAEAALMLLRAAEKKS